MGRPKKSHPLNAHEAILLAALVELHDRVEDGPLLRQHELRLAESGLGYMEREHALDCLLHSGLLERRVGVFERGFSESVFVIDRAGAVAALRAQGIQVALGPEETVSPGGHLSRPSSLAERTA
jgi:hypothetical protein